MSASSRKGAAWETRLLPVLQRVFPYSLRLRSQGRNDKGDYAHTGIWCVEAKNHKSLDLAGWMDEARVEARRISEDQIPVVMFPRRNHPVERAYVLMELGDWLKIAARLEHE